MKTLSLIILAIPVWGKVLLVILGLFFVVVLALFFSFLYKCFIKSIYPDKSDDEIYEIMSKSISSIPHNNFFP